MKKIIVCYFASVLSLLVFVLALTTNEIPLSILAASVFVGNLLWFVDLARKSQKGKRTIEKDSGAEEFYRIDIPLDDDPIEPNLGNVHPGSRLSEAYKAMIGGE